MPYKKIPFSSKFAMMGAKTHALTSDALDETSASSFLDQKTIDERLSHSEVKKDIHRTPWHFGPVRVNGRGEFDDGNAVASASSPEELMLLSDLSLSQLRGGEEEIRKQARLEFLHKLKRLNDMRQAGISLEDKSENAGEFKALPEPVDAWLSNPDNHELEEAALACLKDPPGVADLVRREIEHPNYPPRPLSETVAWFEAGRKKLEARTSSVDDQSKRKKADRAHLSLEESQALFAFALSTHRVNHLQGGSTKALSKLVIEQSWLYTHLGIEMDKFVQATEEEESKLSDFNRIRRSPNGQIKVSVHHRLKSDPAENTDMRYAIEIGQEQSLEKEAKGFHLTTERFDVMVDQKFWNSELLPKAEKKLEELDLDPGVAMNPEKLSALMFAITPFLCEESFRKAFCEKMARRPKEDYVAALPWIEACYEKRPKDLAAIRSNFYNIDYLYNMITAKPGVDGVFKGNFKKFGNSMSQFSLDAYNDISRELKSRFASNPGTWKLAYSSIPLSTRTAMNVKKFIYGNPPRTFAIVLGVVLAATGAALAATGVLAPLGLALGYAGAVMAAPGVVAAFSAACFAAPVILYGIGAGIVKAAKWMGRKVVTRRPKKPFSSAAVMDAMQQGDDSKKDQQVQAPSQHKSAHVSSVEEEKIPEGYKKAQINHDFLTGMRRQCQPVVIGPSWNSAPYTETEIKKVFDFDEGKRAAADIPRLDWFFGERMESKVTERAMMEMASKFTDPESLRIYSWIVPEQSIEGFTRQKRTLTDALKDTASLTRLMEKMKAVGQQLIGAESKAVLPVVSPEALSIIGQYIEGSIKYDEKKIWPAVEEVIAWIERGRAELAKLPNAQSARSSELELSVQESRALCAFADSIGNAHSLQEGCVQGVMEGCFREFWLTLAQQLKTDAGGEGTWYMEQLRLKRISESCISVRSCLEISEVADFFDPSKPLGRAREAGASPAQLSEAATRPLIQFVSEHRFEKTMNETWRVTYTMTPRQQTVLIEKDFWQNVLLKRANDKLAKLVRENLVFKPSDFAALIPYLEDETFCSLFSKALSNQPPYAFEMAKKWVQVCYQGENAEQKQLLEEINSNIDKERRSNSSDDEPTLIRKGFNAEDRVELVSLATNDYVGYLYDPASADPFCTAFEDEMSKLSKDTYDKIMGCMEDNKATWGDKYDSFISRIQIKRKLYGNDAKHDSAPARTLEQPIRKY